MWWSKSRLAFKPGHGRGRGRQRMKPAAAGPHTAPSAESPTDGASPYATSAYATMTDHHRSEFANVTRRLLILFALVAGLVAACGLTYSIAWQRGIDNLRRNAAVRVERTVSVLKSTL